jgi:hypothetical protein
MDAAGSLDTNVSRLNDGEAIAQRDFAASSPRLAC